jgi:protein-S-isoprenylcysteine O-methyltransferase Ste14
MQSLEHKIPPPVVAAVIAAAMWGASSLPPSLPLAADLRHFLAGALAIAGVAFDLLGLFAFHRASTTINPLEPGRASALVTGGVYRVTRNPMYLGLALLLGAWTVHLSMLWPMAGPVLFVLYIDRLQIAPEERVMRSKFGDDYVQYAARVRRWL